MVCLEALLQEPEKTLRQICEHVELEFYEDMLPASHQRIPFGSRFRDRWYPLSLRRVLRYIDEASAEELVSVYHRCGDLARKLGYQTAVRPWNGTTRSANSRGEQDSGEGRPTEQGAVRHSSSRWCWRP